MIGYLNHTNITYFIYKSIKPQVFSEQVGIENLALELTELAF